MTDDRERFAGAIKGRSSAKVGAIDETLLRGKVATIAIPATIKVGGDGNATVIRASTGALWQPMFVSLPVIHN